MFISRRLSTIRARPVGSCCKEEPVEGRRRAGPDPRARGRGVPDRLPGQPAHRGRRRRRTSGRSSSARSGPGIHMADAMSRVTSGEAHRRVRDAVTGRAPRTRSVAWPRRSATRCRSCSCRRATTGATCRHRPNFSACLNYRTSRSGSTQLGPAATRSRRRCAARSPRCGTGGRGRCWWRSRGTSATRRSRPDGYDAAVAVALRTGPGGRRRGRRRARRRPSGRSSTRARASTTPRRGTELRAARRAARGARHHEPPGQERLPRGPSAVARLGRPDDAAGSSTRSSARRTSSSASAAASRRRATASRWPADKRYIHATLDPADLDKDRPVGGRRSWATPASILDALIDECGDRLRGKPRGRVPHVDRSAIATHQRGVAGRTGLPKLTLDEAPMTPVPRDLRPDARRSTSPTRSSPTTPAARAISSRRSGRRRRRCRTSAGARRRSSATASGLAMGAKLAHPDKLCINVMGDAAFGFTGHGLRDRRARADPDPDRACSTTSRWRSS